MAGEKQDMQHLALQHREFQRQAQAVQQQMGMLQVSIEECRKAVNTLESLPAEPEPETLVPIGSGSFLNARILNDDRVVVNIGGGFSVEKPVEDAKVFLNKRCDTLQEILGKLNTSLSGIASKIQAIEAAVAQSQQQPQ
jgi:prefoldin alpha subunit